MSYGRLPPIPSRSNPLAKGARSSPRNATPGKPSCVQSQNAWKAFAARAPHNLPPPTFWRSTTMTRLPPSVAAEPAPAAFMRPCATGPRSSSSAFQATAPWRQGARPASRSSPCPRPKPTSPTNSSSTIDITSPPTIFSPAAIALPIHGFAASMTFCAKPPAVSSSNTVIWQACPCHAAIASSIPPRTTKPNSNADCSNLTPSSRNCLPRSNASNAWPSSKPA